MSALTNLDEIVDYPDKIALALSQDKTVVGLLLNNPNIDMINDEPETLGTQIFNYNYIPDTQTDSLSYITIDTIITGSKYDTTKSLNIIVTVISNKTNMKLDPSIFMGVAGNRRDNLIRYTDLVIRNIKSNTLGIGKLEFTTKSNPVSPVSVGSTSYVAKQLIYEVPNFDGRVKA